MRNSIKDRTDFVPRHEGPNIVPNSPFFTQLVRHANYKDRLAFRDVNAGVERSYNDMLVDALTLREVVRTRLSSNTVESIRQGDEVFIGVLAPGGHEWMTAFLAVLALGAVPVPMTTALPVDEAVYFVTKSQQVALLVADHAHQLGSSTVAQAAQKTKRQAIPCIPISSSLAKASRVSSRILVSSDRALDENAAGLVIFTSGTTGPPKAAVLRRSYIHDASRKVAEWYELTPRDVVLHVLPVHHVTGIAITILPFLVAGACIEFRSGGFDPAWTWNRWRQGGLTFFSGVPTIYMRMWRYYDHTLSKLPISERKSYDAGARAFRALMCGTSALPKPVQQFWTTLRNGHVILTRYGSTEVGAVFMVPLDPTSIPAGSVGKTIPGVDIKLSSEGEVLVKSPFLFSKYLFDDTATADAHDEHGYFKSGDIAVQDERGFHYILGRASQDILKSGGYKLSALDIEREMLGLPYIGEAMVVGVEDLEYGQRVAAAVTLREDQEMYSMDGTGGRNRLSIEQLRADLRSSLAGYKMPTILRVVDDLPKTASGKVQKKILGPTLFPSPGWDKVGDVQSWTNTKAKL